MKLRSNVCNRCLLVCVKFYLNRSRFAVVVVCCEDISFHRSYHAWLSVLFRLKFCIFINFLILCITVIAPTTVICFISYYFSLVF